MVQVPRVVPEKPDQAGDPRNRLLDAAEYLFSERGFLAASVRDITRNAECNVAAVNYYFGNKENLYQEVFRRRLAQLRERKLEGLRKVLGEEGKQPDLYQILETFVAHYLEPYFEKGKNGRWMELMSREVAEQRLPPAMFQEEIIEPTHRAFGDALRQACPGLSSRAARLGLLSVVGQLAYGVRMHRIVEKDPSLKTQIPSLAKLMEHVVRFSAAGFRAYAEEGK